MGIKSSEIKILVHYIHANRHACVYKYIYLLSSANKNCVTCTPIVVCTLQTSPVGIFMLHSMPIWKFASRSGNCKVQFAASKDSKEKKKRRGEKKKQREIQNKNLGFLFGESLGHPLLLSNVVANKYHSNK